MDRPEQPLGGARLLGQPGDLLARVQGMGGGCPRRPVEEDDPGAGVDPRRVVVRPPPSACRRTRRLVRRASRRRSGIRRAAPPGCRGPAGTRGGYRGTRPRKGRRRPPAAAVRRGGDSQEVLVLRPTSPRSGRGCRPAGRGTAGVGSTGKRVSTWSRNASTRAASRSSASHPAAMITASRSGRTVRTSRRKAETPSLAEGQIGQPRGARGAGTSARTRARGRRTTGGSGAHGVRRAWTRAFMPRAACRRRRCHRRRLAPGRQADGAQQVGEPRGGVGLQQRAHGVDPVQDVLGQPPLPGEVVDDLAAPDVVVDFVLGAEVEEEEPGGAVRPVREVAGGLERAAGQAAAQLVARQPPPPAGRAARRGGRATPAGRGGRRGSPRRHPRPARASGGVRCAAARGRGTPRSASRTARRGCARRGRRTPTARRAGSAARRSG